MIIIGEKLNSSLHRANTAMSGSDEDLLTLIREQEAGGANYLDVNTALFGTDEFSVMERLIGLIHKHSRCIVMPDSPDIDVLYKAARLCEGRCLLNSFSAGDDLTRLIDLMRETGCSAVILPTESGRVPTEPRERLELAKSALSRLNAAGISSERVYIDILATSLAVNPNAARQAIETLRLLKAETDAMTICGVSNISFGLPKRVLINSAFLTTAIFDRIDAAIIDPCRSELVGALRAAEAVSGCDDYCVEYINFVREEYL